MYKTFKIGEYCRGGIIVADVNKGIVKITVQDWDTKETIDCKLMYDFDEFAMNMFLNDQTSCYYADKVMDYIKKALNKS